MTPKVTGGTTQAGAVMSYAISAGMTFRDGILERDLTLAAARVLRDRLLDAGFDVLMLRDDVDVQLDNVARTVICNNTAACHISLHWDSDGLDYDKGAFFMSVPDGIKYLENVAAHWEESEKLGTCLIDGLRERGVRIFKNGSYDMDLTQTAYSWIPSVDIELGNQCSEHSEQWLENQVEGLLQGIKAYFEQ
jgi:N-acetylmuramoyl-L-alanine amidase